MLVLRMLVLLLLLLLLMPVRFRLLHLVASRPCFITHFRKFNAHREGRTTRTRQP